MQSAGIVLPLPKWREPARQAAFITFLKTSLNGLRFLQVSVDRGWSRKLQQHHNTTYLLMRNSVTRVTYSGVTRPRAAMFAARSMPSLRLLCYPGGHRLQTGAISSRSRDGGSESLSHRCPNDYQSSVLCSHKREIFFFWIFNTYHNIRYLKNPPSAARLWLAFSISGNVIFLWWRRLIVCGYSWILMWWHNR